MITSIHTLYCRLQESPLGMRLFKGASWSLFGMLFNYAALMLVSLILTHLLGRYVYGQYGMIRSTVNMFIIFCSYALGTTATKYLAEFRDHNKERAGRILGLSLISVVIFGVMLFSICFLGSDVLAERTLNSTELAPFLRLGALMVLFACLNGLLNGALSGLEAFAEISYAQSISGVIMLIGALVGGYYWGLKGALIGYIIYLCSLTLFFACYLRLKLRKFAIRVSLHGIMQELPMLWKFSLPAMLIGISVTPVIWAGNVILVNSPGSYNAMAGFDIINQWKMMILFVPGAVSKISLPILSNLSSAGKHTDFRRVIKINIALNTAVALILSLVIGSISKWILHWYGAEFVQYSNALLILLLSSVVCVANGVVGQVIMSKGYAWYGCIFNTLWAISFLGFTWLFVQVYSLGVSGMALAYLFSYLVHTIWQVVFMLRMFKTL